MTSQCQNSRNISCLKGTITAARVHATLFGRGGVLRDGLSFIRQVVSPEIIQEFLNFITQDDTSRPSSCRRVLMDGKETGIRYWLCDIKQVIQQHQLKFPGGLKRTYIFSHVHKNFHMNSMLEVFATFAMTLDIQTLIR